MPEQFIRVYDYNDAPTIKKFNEDKRFFRLILGPYGSGKSSGCVAEIIDVGVNQAPDQSKVRRTRWAVVRSTYRMLYDTTMATFFQWLPPEHFGTFNVTNYIYNINKIALDDGTKVEIEVAFRALDKPEHVRNLLSLELTGAWFNEIRETPKIIVDNMEGRVNRYPSKMDGGCTWAGIIADSNPPDVDSWIYKLFEEQVPKSPELQAKYVLFKQPSGRSPEAENRKYLPDNYYENMAIGKDPEFIKVYVDGEYGYIRDGKPVFGNYIDSMHCAEEAIMPIRGVPIIIALDFGLSPAAVICQYLPKGFFHVIAEFTSEDMGIRRFFNDVIKPYIFANLRGYEIVITGDPAGARRQDTDERSCFDELKILGYPATPAHTNSFLARYNAVDSFLTKTIEGKAAFRLSPTCAMLRKGFLGEYKLKKYKGLNDRYSEVPVKNEFSHCLCGDTIVAAVDGPVAIKDIKVGDVIVTPLGCRAVTSTMTSITNELIEILLSDGRKITCTPDHPFITKKGIVRADTLWYGDVLESINNAIKEEGEWEGQKNTTRAELTKSYSIKNHLDIIKLTITNMGQSICTVMFGNCIMDKYRMATSCTTLTGIDQTIISTTLNSWRNQNIKVCTQESELKRIQKESRITLEQLLKQQNYGIHPQKEENGIRNMAKTLGKIKLLANIPVLFAGKIIPHIKTMSSAVFAPQLANQKRDVTRESITNNVPAQYAEAYSYVISTPKQEHAVKVVGVKRLEEQRQVYDLTVEGAHCFYANGILVGNCHDALQYAAMIVDRAAVIEKTRSPLSLRYNNKRYGNNRPTLAAWT